MLESTGPLRGQGATARGRRVRLESAASNIFCNGCPRRLCHGRIRCCVHRETGLQARSAMRLEPGEVKIDRFGEGSSGADRAGRNFARERADWAATTTAATTLQSSAFARAFRTPTSRSALERGIKHEREIEVRNRPPPTEEGRRPFCVCFHAISMHCPRRSADLVMNDFGRSRNSQDPRKVRQTA